MNGRTLLVLVAVRTRRVIKPEQQRARATHVAHREYHLVSALRLYLSESEAARDVGMHVALPKGACSEQARAVPGSERSKVQA